MSNYIFLGSFWICFKVIHDLRICYQLYVIIYPAGNSFVRSYSTYNFSGHILRSKFFKKKLKKKSI